MLIPHNLGRMLTVALFAFVAIGYPAQVTRAQEYPYSGAFGPPSERDKIRAKLQFTRDQKGRTKAKFIVDFIHLPPKQRIEQWLKIPPVLYGSTGEGPFLFPSDRNPRGHQTGLKTVWRKTLRRAKIPYFRIYDLRSTYATRLEE